LGVKDLSTALTTILQAEPYNLKVITDVKHLRVLDDLNAFMTRLGQARYVVEILTAEFLRSENCMYELTTMANQGKLGERLFPIVYEDAAIKDSRDRVKHAQYWSARHKELSEVVAVLPAKQVTNSTKAELGKLEGIVRGCQDALAGVSNMRYLSMQAGESLDVQRIAEYILDWTSGIRKDRRRKLTRSEILGLGFGAIAVRLSTISTATSD
jgi:hypothetical protein